MKAQSRSGRGAGSKHTLVALRHAHILTGSSSLDVPAISNEVSCELLRTHAWVHKAAKHITIGPNTLSVRGGSPAYL